MRKALRRTNARLRVEVSGIGPAAAARTAEEALNSASMRAAVVVGLCGWLTPEFGVGDVALYGSIRSAEGRSLAIDPDALRELAAVLPSARPVCAVESGSIVSSARAKAELARRSGAQAVDMESFALVDRLQRAGIPVGVVRVGSDRSDEELPDLATALDERGRLDPWKTLGAMLRRPGAGLRLARDGLRALAELERTVERIGGYASGAAPSKP